MLTPEQARDLVAWGGSVKGAARKAGVHHATLRHWLDPEKGRERMRRRYNADPEAVNAAHREAYHAESGLDRARRQLRMRRTKALIRRAARESRRVP